VSTPTPRISVIAPLALLLAACVTTKSTTNSTPTNVPLPPAVPGCYTYDPARAGRGANPWVKATCLTPEQIARLPHPQADSQFGPPTPCVGTCSASAPNPPQITMGSVSVNFLPGPFTRATYPLFQVIDTCITPQCQTIASFGATAGNGRFSFSVQANTNAYPIACNASLAAQAGFACTTGDQGWVQFVYQWDIGGYCFLCNGATSALCIWFVDLSVVNPNSASKEGFQPECAGPPDIGFNPSVAWWTSPNQPITLTALHSTGTGNQPVLMLFGCFPWAVPQGAPSCLTSVVAPDFTGLCPDPSTSNCQWTEVTGGLVGIGNASTAVFPAGTTMATEVASTGCVPIPPYALGYTPPPAFTDLGIFPVTFFGATLPPFGGPPCTGSYVNYISPPYTNGWTQDATMTTDAAGFTGATGETNNLNPPQDPQAKPQPPITPACFAGSCWIDYTSSN